MFNRPVTDTENILSVQNQKLLVSTAHDDFGRLWMTATKRHIWHLKCHERQ